MKKLFAIAMLVFAQEMSAQEISYPVAEFTKAKSILMYTPGEELFDGIIHPAAGLYDDYFDVDMAAEEHLGYIEKLRANDIEVLRVQDILQEVDKDKLIALADGCLKYDGTALKSITPDSLENYRQKVLHKMSKKDLIRCIINHPTVILSETGINTGLVAVYQHESLMNMYFLRDQSITTPKGHIMCKMNSQQRTPEVDIVEACYKHMGEEPVYRISGENSRLEGGDYIPMGTFAFLGQGLRTNQGAIDEMLENDVIGHDTLVVVRERWKDQYQMHLDTYFNVIDKDLATLCFNRYDAEDESDINFLTIDMYARQPGTKAYHTVDAYAGMSFKKFLAEKGIKVIRISKEDADHYANNFLAIDARHIMSVAHQSDALAAEYEKNGVTVEWIELENLIGGYGASHCMTQVLQRTGYQAPTVVNAVKAEGNSTHATYTLDGVPATDEYKGVVVKNNKKVLK